MAFGDAEVLIEIPNQEEIVQDLTDGAHGIQNYPWIQSFIIPGTKNLLLKNLYILVDPPTGNNVSGSYRMGIAASLGSIYSVSNEIYDSSDDYGLMEFSWGSNGYELDHSTLYYLYFLRSTYSPSSKYPNWAYSSANPYSGGMVIEQTGAATWVNHPTDDFYFVMNFAEDFDITEYVREIDLDTGKSDVDGKWVEGTCDLRLRNKLGEFNINNPNSLFGDDFDLYSKIKVNAVEGALREKLFIGFITDIRPNDDFEDRTIELSCSDLFFAFKDMKVSPGSLSGYTADQLIEAILLEMGLVPGEFDLDTTDISVLADVTWSDIDGLSTIEDIVAAGAHSHFMGGDGVYYFKSNQWLDSQIPDFLFNDPDSYDGIKVQYSLSAIINSVRVKYSSGATGAWTDWNSNPQSIQKYNQRDYEHSYPDILRPLVYAEIIRDYILDLFSSLVSSKGIELFLEGRPISLMRSIKIGSILQVTNDYLGIFSTSYVVYGLKRSISTDGNHDLTLRCKPWIAPPPISSWYWEYTYLPGYGAQKVLLQSLTSGNAASYSQSFEVPTSGTLLEIQVSVEFRVNTYTPSLSNIYMKVYSNSGDKPGTLLATSDPVNIADNFEGIVSFLFSGVNQISLTSGTRVVWYFETPACQPLTSMVTRVKGQILNPDGTYAEGKAGYAYPASTNVTLVNNLDITSNVKVKT